MSVEQEVSYRKVQLVTYSKSDGPLVPVSRMRKLEVRDATKKDAVRLHFVDHDLAHAPAPLDVRGSGIKHLNFPRGTVRIERVSGKTPITVLAHCERFVRKNGYNQTDE